MKTIAYCWSCNKEHDITNKGVQEYGYQCKCGGFIISPTGKVNMKLISENDEDLELLGISIQEKKEEKPLPKVFKMDNYSWVCAMDEEKAVSWYINTIGVEKEELEVYECDIDTDRMYSEISMSAIVEKLEGVNNNSETNFNIIKRFGSLFIHETFRTAIEDMIKNSGYEVIISEPFEICSREC